MIKYLFTCLLLFTGLAAISQPKKSVVNLISSERSQGIKRNGADIIKVYNGIFKQDYSTLKSDSAYFYPQLNSFDAYGHVIISQGDTLNIYSDKLNYNGNTHVALLTNNVRMVDKDATLTTNYLTYNTATRIGTYTGGGKLVNKDNTLTSTNGYYYAFKRDAYFRYNVVLNTVDALIKTDTLRYNSGSRIAYFYGPTHIYGKKHKDTLYTENGTYNTVTEQAFFGKKNLYTQNTKSLKGDSLFYDRLKGYGRAIKNVVFNDNEEKITLHGDIGTYYESGEKAVVTRNPWVTIVTEEKDSTKTDSAAKKTAPVAKGDKKAPVFKPAPNTKPISIDSAKNIVAKTTPALGAAVITQSVNTDTVKHALTKAKAAAITQSVNTEAVKKAVAKATPILNSVDTRPVSADTVRNAVAKATARKKAVTPAKPVLVRDTSAKVKQDTIYMAGDTLTTWMTTYKGLKEMQEKQRLAAIRDTSAKAKKVAAAPKSTSKFLVLQTPKLKFDSSFLHKDFFGAPRKTVPKQLSKQQLAKNIKKAAADSVRQRKAQLDSVNLTHTYKLSDTSRVRVLIAHNNVKIYKSDLQAKADSVFYSTSDSTIRCYIKPMVWSQGSQMSGDTIYLQMKNKKLDNMDIFPSAFIVNVEARDSIHFNQIGGKKMKGFFADNRLSRMFVDGNAESIYFMRDSGVVSAMERSLSSRIRVNFRNNEALNLLSISKPEHHYGPLDKFKEDERILKGFIWKPKDRPESKEQIIPALDIHHRYKRTVAKSAAKAPGAGKSKAAPAKLPGKNQPMAKPASDSTMVTKGTVQPAVKDSTIKAASEVKPAKAVKDTVKKP